MTSIPQFNPLAATVLSQIGYTPVVSAVGVHFGVATPAAWFATKVGNIVRLSGVLVYDVSQGVTTEVICKLTPPAFDALINAFGTGITVNAATKGGTEGSGVIVVTWDALNKLLVLTVDSQAHANNAYAANFDITLIVRDAS